jgi:hypothetical protein
MVAEVRPNYESDWAAITAVAQKLGIGTAETLSQKGCQVARHPEAMTIKQDEPDGALRIEVSSTRRLAGSVFGSSTRGPRTLTPQEMQDVLGDALRIVMARRGIADE